MPAHQHAAIQAIDLAGFLTLGLLGGLGHCAGMCAPFVMFVSRRFAAPEGARGALAAQLWYHAGRLVTYALLGAVAGAVGGVVELAGSLLGLQRAASVGAGVVLVMSALAALTHLLPSRPGGETVVSRIARGLRGRAPGHPFLVGLFLGLLPCGLLYSAIIAAVSRGGAVAGATALALFSLGTAATLLGVALADELLARRRLWLNRLSQLFILAMGVWFIWTGFAHIHQ